MSATKTMNTTTEMTTGSKGSDVWSSTGNDLLDLSVRLVRGADSADIQSRTRAVAARCLEDAWVLAFHVRNVRGGRGERQLFYDLVSALWEVRPALAERLLALVPDYGSWQDLFHIAETQPGFHNPVLQLARAQLEKDRDDAAAGAASLSLCAKWAPREGKQKELAKRLADLLFKEGPFSHRMREYRKLVADLNRRIGTVETQMTPGHWADIDPAKVPGRAGKIYTRAFLNLVNTTKKDQELTREQKSALRHPDDVDRMACRERFEAHFARAKEGKAKVHGASTVFPHEIVRKAYQGLGGSPAGYYAYPDDTGAMPEEEKDHLRAVWRAMIEKARTGGGLRRSIFMCDFSGSMQSAGTQGDLPYWVSMALGLLGSSLTTDAFRNKIMTFDSNPMWHTFPETDDLFDRLATLAGSIGQGTSTDFQAAMDLVLKTLKAQRVRPGEEPENLIVLTDMNWDAACASNQRGYWTGYSYRQHVKTEQWQTHVEMIRESFRRAGEDLWGTKEDGGLGGWAMPRIVIWNLAANPTDFHATADTPGVAMLAGWSPTQFRILQQEGPRQMTPYETLRLELDDPQYDRVRAVVQAYEAEVAAAPRHYNGWGAADGY